MSIRKPPESEQDILNAFADLFDEIQPETSEEIDTILIEAGFEPEQVAANMQALAEKALGESPLNWRKQASRKRQQAEQGLRELESTIPTNRTDILTAFKDFAKRRPEQYRLAMLQFRNLEEASDKDLQTLLAELIYLESRQSQDQSDN